MAIENGDYCNMEVEVSRNDTKGQSSIGYLMQMTMKVAQSKGKTVVGGFD